MATTLHPSAPPRPEAIPARQQGEAKAHEAVEAPELTFTPSCHTRPSALSLKEG